MKFDEEGSGSGGYGPVMSLEGQLPEGVHPFHVEADPFPRTEGGGEGEGRVEGGGKAVFAPKGPCVEIEVKEEVEVEVGRRQAPSVHGKCLEGGEKGRRGGRKGKGA